MKEPSRFILKLDGNTELARAVDVMMARAKRIYILKIDDPQSKVKVHRIWLSQPEIVFCFDALSFL